MGENPYHLYFKNSVGYGGSVDFEGIGPLYRARRGVRGYGEFSRNIRGAGVLGNIFSFFKKMASPLIKAVAPSAIETVTNVAKDAIDGANIKDSLKKHASTEAKKLLGKVPDSFSKLLTKSGQLNSENTSSTVAAEQERPPAPKRQTSKETQTSRNPRYTTQETSSSVTFPSTQPYEIMTTVTKPIRGAPPPPYNLFKPRTISEVAVHGHYESLYPVTGIDERNSGPITFVIKGTDAFLDFNKLYMTVKGKFIGKAKDTAGKVIDIKDPNFPKFGPTNLQPHSLIQTVNVTVNNKSVALGDQHYPYRAYIQTLLNNNKDVLSTIGLTEGWCKDSGQWDSFDSSKNPALETRKQLGNDKHEYSYTIRLCTPLFQLPEVFLPQCDVEVSIIKNSNPQFYIMHDPSATMDFIITDAVLHVRKTTTTDEYRNGVEKTLAEKIPLELILGDPRIFTKSISAGDTYLNIDYLTFGNLPRRLVLAMVETTAFNGQSDMNPYRFQHFNVSKVSLFKNGLPYPTQPVAVNFKRVISPRDIDICLPLSNQTTARSPPTSL